MRFGWIMIGLLLAAPECFAAGDNEAILVLQDGQKISIPYGYDQVAEAMKTLRDEQHKVVQVIINGAPLMINVAKVAAICKGKCSYLTVVDTRDPARAPSRGIE